MPPESGGICGRLTEDLPLGDLQGGVYTCSIAGGRSTVRECKKDFYKWTRKSKGLGACAFHPLKRYVQGYLAHKKLPPH